jgi:16S rRNA (adenine1518-N6/adenine1519-N6)-dimethyltransferase
MPSISPRKSLGQHFLTDRNIANKIVSSLLAEGCNAILEVGPGTGILTSLLLDRYSGSVRFVEIDHKAVSLLLETFPGISNRLIHGNFLDLDIRRYCHPPVALIGNLPYNISSQILFKVLDNRNIIPEVVCMVQKEVARRIASPPGNKEYGILSVLLQAFYSIEYLFSVPPHVFHPPPAVHSGVIRMKRNDTERLACDEGKFFRVVKTAFNQRRKMIRNALQQHFVYLQPDDPLLLKRPEQLNISEFISLTNQVEYYQH